MKRVQFAADRLFYAGVLLDAATKLQEHTKKLKTYVATLDATACHAAMKGGVLGAGLGFGLGLGFGFGFGFGLGLGLGLAV